MDEKRLRLRQIVLAGIFAALIFVITYFVKIPLPQISHGAYINLGDTAIYMVAALINPVFAMFSAGVGSMLADVAYGGGVYIPATLIIKGLMGFTVSVIAKNGSFAKFAIACVVGGLIMVVGYGLFETALFGFKVAIAASLYNIVQLVGGVLLALPLYAVLPRIKKATNRELD